MNATTLVLLLLLTNSMNFLLSPRSLTKPPVARKLAVVHLLHSAFILSMVKKPLKGGGGGGVAVGGCSLNSHGNYIFDRGK